jgi:L-aspartate oxidase
MSGISSIGSSPVSSGLSSSLGSSSLPNGGLSSVGASLLSTGQAPNPVPDTSTAAPTNSAGLTSYQSEFLNLQAYDDQELMYASSLSFSAGLANADSVFLQAAALLGTPGSTLSTGVDSTLSTGTNSTGATGSTGTTGTTNSTSSTSTASSALNNLPSVASILAASDDEADQTLNAYANAPVGSSILDYQA